MCIKKLKKREERMKDIKYQLGDWTLWKKNNLIKSLKL